MKTAKTETKRPAPLFFPVSVLREQLWQDANALTHRLSRSVGRLTSCDALPCPEYGEEVQFQQTLTQRLFYLQHCRTALEKCIAGADTTLRYRWADGRVTHTRFRMTGPGRVKVMGFVK